MSMTFAKRSFSLEWEVLNLVAMKCDPKTLATASCVSKSWSSSLSSDHLWKSICTTHFPSLSNLYPSISYRRIYALGHASVKRRRQPPHQPRLSINDILFAVTIPLKSRDSPITILKPFAELENHPEGRFRFDVSVKDVVSGKMMVDEEEDDDMKISCCVVMKGYESVFKVVDRKGKTSKREWWFTEELPSAGCCFCNGASGLLAEITLVFGETIIVMTGAEDKEKKERKNKVVEKVRIGVMNVVSTWRYASVDDTLRYLQHFLLPTPTTARLNM